MNETEHKCRKCGRIIDTKKGPSWYELHYIDGLVVYLCSDKCIIASAVEIQGLLK